MEDLFGITIMIALIVSPFVFFNSARRNGKGIGGALFSAFSGFAGVFVLSAILIAILDKDKPTAAAAAASTAPPVISAASNEPSATHKESSQKTVKKKPASSTKNVPFIIIVDNITIVDPKNHMRQFLLDLNNCKSDAETSFLSSSAGYKIECVMTYNRPKNYGSISIGDFKAISYDSNNVRVSVDEFPTQNINPGESIKTTLIYHPLKEVSRVVICAKYLGDC